MSLALVFNAGVYLWLGPRPRARVFDRVSHREALSGDNLFVFLVIFTAFGLLAAIPHRVLYWRILGAMVL